jgi:hypothetical protein
LPELAPAEKSLIEELDLECHWFLSARTEFIQAEVALGFAKGHDLQRLRFDEWRSVDQMLVHVERIDRIVHPRRGQDSLESYEVRLRVGKLLGELLGGDILKESELAKVRAIVEHSNEYVADFVLAHPGKRRAAIAVGPNVKEESPDMTVALRYYDTVSGVCTVYGKSVDLQQLERDVRKLKFVLPSQVAREFYVPSLPEPNDSPGD